MVWEKKNISPDAVRDISAKYGCDTLTASILVRRGLTAGEDLRYYLENDLRHLRNPFELPGMEDAVDRILAAKEEGEKVLVFGDRDVDGITSTALVAGFLLRQGMDVSWRLPQGDEPYGLSITAVEEFAAASGSLIITVDCGISNIAEVRRAGELGIDVVITDHHNPQEQVPNALSIVNPKLTGSVYPFRNLAGCGVAYKLVAALRFALKSELYAQPVCLLNTRPVNEAWVVEIAKLRNLALVDTLTETVIPGMVNIGNTRLPSFLEGQQILTWDAPFQKKALSRIFGGGVDINMLDIAGEIGKEIPSTSGKTLLRLKELSKMAKYAEREIGELEVFTNLFISFVYLREKIHSPEDSQDLQLACLGTVADIMPLKDENRIIVRQGLASIMEKPRPGLSDLLFKMDLSGRRIGAHEISWLICPAINAAGRMGSPHTAAALFLEQDPLVRDGLADKLITMNEERKKLGGEIWISVEPEAEKNLKKFDHKLAMASGKIPRGITGIMANRLVSRFKTPSLVVSVGEEILTGSLRSYRDYDLRFLLEPCAHLFIDWGGHDFAAGFSMEKSNWETFLEILQKLAQSIDLGEEEEEKVEVDAELPLSYLTPDILNLVDRFEPYGEGNEPLTFMARGLRVSELNLMGKIEANHVKLSLDAGRYKWPAVYWQAADKVKKEFDLEDRVDLAFRVIRDWFNGRETPQLVISDLRREGAG